VFYTADNTVSNPVWELAETLVITPENPVANWFNQRSVNLSSFTALNNNPNVGLRIVASFDPGTGNYLAVNSNNTYSTNGTARYDMVHVIATTPAQSVTVTESGTYSLTVTSFDGCSYSDTITVTVTDGPELNISASATAVCEGESVTLTASGDAATYSWSGGVENGVAFTPAQTATYTVTATDATGCESVESITITVNAFPVVTANASAIEVCEGDMVTLTGSGADSYTWSGGVQNGVPFAISATTTFTVTGTSNGCSDTDEITITVNPLPQVTLQLNLPDTLCVEDGIVELSGGSPAGGNWSGNGVTGASFDPAAAGAGVHVITYTYADANGCSASASEEVLVEVCINVNDMLLTQVTVFPNPFNQFVNIRWEQLPSTDTEIKLMDILGRTITFRQLDHIEVLSGTYRLELGQLAAGSYILEMRSGTAVYRQTLLKAQ